MWDMDEEHRELLDEEHILVPNVAEKKKYWIL